MSVNESKFGLYQLILNSALNFYRRGKLDDGDKCIGQMREIIADSQHPEDLGFLYYLEFYRYFCSQDYPTALSLLDKAEIYFEQLDNPSRSVLIRHYRAFTYFNMKEYEQAATLYRLALDNMDDSVNIDTRCAVLNNLGECYTYLGKFHLALEYCYRAMKLRREHSLPGIGSSCYNLAIIYTELQEYDHSIDFGNQAIEVFRQEEDKRNLAKMLNVLGIAYASIGNYEQGLSCFNESLQIREDNQENTAVALVLNGIGNLYYQQEDYVNALTYHKKALQIRQTLNDSDYIASSLLNLGKSSLMLKKPQDAVNHLQEALACGIKRPVILAEVYHYLSRAFGALGDSAQALEYLNEYLTRIKTLWEEEKSSNLAEMKTKLELDKREQELEHIRTINSELEKKNHLIESQKAALENTLADLRKSELKLSFVKNELSQHTGYNRIVGVSEAMKNILELMRKVAYTDDTSVLITGESGTGKELVARGIHEMSSRKSHYFYAVNASAVSSTLFESEFFGHEKGAFTGADSMKPGWFEVANNGTLFLDEIGNMPVDQQIKLLRALDGRNIIRVGARREIAVNIRVISATNVNLEELIEQKAFRSDLYHRLAVFVINIPPLRERREDIPVLTEHFVRYYQQKLKKSVRRIDPEVYNALSRYHFPGNVRELANMVEKGMIMCDSQCLQIKHFAMHEAKPGIVVAENHIYPLHEMEKTMLVKALLSTGFNQAKAANLLGISAKGVERRVSKFKIRKEDYLIDS
ncbi:MAG: sigma 54-interacting transcriptional regulator [Candidatus Cloacimonetes bacterium]|nr:sigma 54-interacting transcriptional regulator [Candidatus Cloacimonadota bacterium]